MPAAQGSRKLKTDSTETEDMMPSNSSAVPAIGRPS
jgi:hypothetical protein